MSLRRITPGPLPLPRPRHVLDAAQDTNPARPDRAIKEGDNINVAQQSKEISAALVTLKDVQTRVAPRDAAAIKSVIDLLSSLATEQNIGDSGVEAEDEDDKPPAKPTEAQKRTAMSQLSDSDRAVLKVTGGCPVGFLWQKRRIAANKGRAPASKGW